MEFKAPSASPLRSSTAASRVALLGISSSSCMPISATARSILSSRASMEAATSFDLDLPLLPVMRGSSFSLRVVSTGSMTFENSAILFYCLKHFDNEKN
ncbi:hypothetical protein F0562_002732 [Nyssa sinensis]|uniref:Uncharacterized protein n=1 Tax=Nyssa sinensis TaxID=561372 RepID=A0A5J5BU73_9ASTE|nr:hypothetical protein F0562_002732 [Nyssa sinensis]